MLSHNHEELKIDELSSSIQKSDSDDIEIELTTEQLDTTDDLFDDTNQENNSYLLSKKIQIPLKIIPIGMAANDAIQTAIGMTKKPTWLTLTASSGAFISSTAIYHQYTKQNLIELALIATKTGELRNRLPPSWSQLELSNQKELIALGLTLVITSYVTFSDSMLSYFISQKFPSEFGFNKVISEYVWMFPSITIAGLTGIGIVLTKGVETWKTMREMLSKHKKQYANRLSRYVSPVAGISLGLIGSTADAIGSFVGIKEVFLITSTQSIITLGIASSLNLIADYSLTSHYVRSEINHFIDYLSTHRPTKNDIISFALSSGLSALLAYAWQGLADIIFQEFFSGFGVTSSTVASTASSIMSWGVAVNYFVVCTASIHHAVDYLLLNVVDLSSKIKDKLCINSYTADKDNESYEMDDIKIDNGIEANNNSTKNIPMTPSIGKNPNTMFNQNAPKNDNKSRCKSVCPFSCSIV